MDVLTGARMKKVDEETIARFCPGLELMERAGRRVAEFVIERYPADGFKAAIFAGPGNNGGDALVVARYLSEEGRNCSLYCLKPPDAFTIDAFKNYQRLRDKMEQYRGLKEINFTRPDWVEVLKKDLVDGTLIIDGIFGTGLSRDVEGRAREVIEIINGRGLPTVSIDIPSGIHSDTGAVLGTAIKATHTVTMGYPKLGMLFHPGREHAGELLVADLGFPDEVLQVQSLGMYLLDGAEAAKRLPRRPVDLHKYQAGTVLLVAGSRAYTGAAILAAEAVLRSGAGLVYLAVPEGIRAVVQTAFREAIVVPLPETAEGSFAKTGMAALEPYLERADAVAVGPGVGAHTETAGFTRDLVETCGKPTVLDADGLGAYAGAAKRLAKVSHPVVLTPHTGELKRLIDRDIPTTPIDKTETTRSVAEELGAVLVHKGAPTLVASPQGEVWVGCSGHSALATAGTGDVLTGLLAGLLAQGSSALNAATIAVFVHGRAGELASERSSRRSMVASDLLSHVGRAFFELE